MFELEVSMSRNPSQVGDIKYHRVLNEKKEIKQIELYMESICSS